MDLKSTLRDERNQIRKQLRESFYVEMKKMQNYL